MIHKVGCPHVGSAGEWDTEFGDIVRKAKVCHKDRSSLMAWADVECVNVVPCSDCKPEFA